jgi:hypothetical protein
MHVAAHAAQGGDLDASYEVCRWQCDSRLPGDSQRQIRLPSWGNL